MTNYKVLFSLRILKSVLSTFVDSFLVLYFLQLSDSSILPLGIYNLISVLFVFGTIFCVRNIAKSKHRINLLRIGILIDFIYFCSILILREKVVDYIYLVGALYGLEEGFYFSVYNMFESDGVNNEERAKYTGMYTSVKSILAIVFPIFIGSYILTSGFLSAVCIVLVICSIRIVLSFKFKDENLPKGDKTNIAEYLKIVGKNTNLREMYKLEIWNGLTYSAGAFSSIVTIYIIKVFSNSFSLGICTSLFSILVCLIGIAFAKWMKPENYSRNIKITTFFTIISLFAMITNCNMVTIVLFNFFQTISKNLTELINGTNQFNLSNMEVLRKEYKVEYFLGMEFSLVIGRAISHILFITMAFMEDTTIMMVLFSMFLILYEVNSVVFNDEMRNKSKENYLEKVRQLSKDANMECE